MSLVAASCGDDDDDARERRHRAAGRTDAPIGAEAPIRPPRGRTEPPPRRPRRHRGTGSDRGTGHHRSPPSRRRSRSASPGPTCRRSSPSARVVRHRRSGAADARRARGLAPGWHAARQRRRHRARLPELRRARRRDQGSPPARSSAPRTRSSPCSAAASSPRAPSASPTRFQIPVIDTDQATAATMEAAAPYMFTLKPDTNESSRCSPTGPSSAARSRARTSGCTGSRSQDDAADAVEADPGRRRCQPRLRDPERWPGSRRQRAGRARRPEVPADGVDQVIFLVGSSGIVNFLQAADDQGYKPGYLDLEWSSHMSDVAAAAYNQNQWDGVEALSATRLGELARSQPRGRGLHRQLRGVQRRRRSTATRRRRPAS